jgi:hypothetical protein
MNTSRMTRLLQLAPAIVAAVLLLGTSRPASAFECFQNLAKCYARAGTIDDWGGRWLMGLDCELDFTDCTRRALIGR